MTQTKSSTDLAAFRRDAAEHLDRLARSGGVEILTVDGQPKGVVMAPHVFDEMADTIEQARITAAIRRGLDAAAAGRVRPAEDVYRDLVSKFGLDPAIVYGDSADDA